MYHACWLFRWLRPRILPRREEADQVVSLEDDEPSGEIGLYYSDFRQIFDQEVIETLGRFPAVAYSD